MIDYAFKHLSKTACRTNWSIIRWLLLLRRFFGFIVCSYPISPRSRYMWIIRLKDFLFLLKYFEVNCLTLNYEFGLVQLLYH